MLECSVSSVGMSEAGKSLIHEFESVRDELESLQVDAESEKKALQVRTSIVFLSKNKAESQPPAKPV